MSENKITPEQFAYWLQGYAEISGATAPTSEQWEVIKEHLNLVFQKVTSTKVSPQSTGVATEKGKQKEDIQPQTSFPNHQVSGQESCQRDIGRDRSRSVRGSVKLC